MTTKEKLGLTQKEWEEFEKIRTETQCEKSFQCVHAEIEMLCKAKYHSDSDIIECLEEVMEECKFSTTFSEAQICTCPMRQFFARHFEKWMEKASDEDA